MDTDLERLLRTLRGIRVPLLREERQLHSAIAQALEKEGIPFRREASLGSYARVDFLCGSVAIEAKKGRQNPRALCSQLTRYASGSMVSALVLVTECSVSLPDRLLGKPLYLVALNRLWGVAL